MQVPGSVDNHADNYRQSEYMSLQGRTASNISMEIIAKRTQISTGFWHQHNFLHVCARDEVDAYMSHNGCVC